MIQKHYFKIAMLGAVALTAFAPSKKSWTDLKVKKVQKFIEKNNVRIIDVRTKEEFDEGHLADAENIDFKSDTFVVAMEEGKRDQMILLYCKAGVRGAGAAFQLDSLGYTNVHNMKGGYTAWSKKYDKE